MEDRYRKMALMNVRNIAGYNQKLADMRKSGNEMKKKVQVGFDENGLPMYEDQVMDTSPMPYIVNIAIAHDDDTIAQGHGFGLVVGNINEGGVDTLTELDDLSTHLVTQLGVEVGERLVHQHDLRVTDDGTTDGDTLSLTTGQSLGLTLEVLGDVEDLSGFTDLLVNDILRLLAKLQREGHVVVHGHVGVQSVVLEDHGDIAVFRRDVVHELAVNDQLTAADLFKAGDHTKGGGLAAAGRSDQNDEFLIGDIQVEFLNSDNAFIRDLEIDFLLLRFVCFLFLFLLLAAYEGVDFLDVFQLNSCHASDSGHPASAKDALTTARRGTRRITTGLHTAAPRAWG